MTLKTGLGFVQGHADAKNSESKHLRPSQFQVEGLAFFFFRRPLNSNTVTLDKETPVAYKRSGVVFATVECRKPGD